MSRSGIIRFLFAIIAMLVGVAIVVSVGPNPTSREGELALSLGVAFIVTGIVTGFREVAILRSESVEVGEEIARRVHRHLLESPPSTSGIRLVASVRWGYDGYYAWAIARGPQKLFFAGRSVLHTIDADLRRRGIGPVETTLVRRLREGATIQILFFDPRSNIIERLAKEEGQSLVGMLSDIAVSTGICRKLYELLEKSDRFTPQAELKIRVYDEIPHFAYHRESDKESDKVVIGFYSARTIGARSPAFEIMDTFTKDLFHKHFDTIFERAPDRTLLEFVPERGRCAFNEELFKELYATLVNHLGEEKTDELITSLRR